MQAQEQPEVDQGQAQHGRHEEGCGLMKSGASDIITHPPDSMESRTVFVGTPLTMERIQANQQIKQEYTRQTTCTIFLSCQYNL